MLSSEGSPKPIDPIEAYRCGIVLQLQIPPDVDGQSTIVFDNEDFHRGLSGVIVDSRCPLAPRYPKSLMLSLVVAIWIPLTIPQVSAVLRHLTA